MNPLKSPALRGSAVALALTALALVASLVLGPYWDSYLEPHNFLLFIVSVGLSAWYQGRIGGFTATVASAGAILYYILRPDLGISPSFKELSPLFWFVAMASLITWVIAAWREGRRLLAAALS